MGLINIPLGFLPGFRVLNRIGQFVVILTDIVAGHPLHPGRPGTFIADTINDPRTVPEYRRNLQAHLLIRFTRIGHIRQRHRPVAVGIRTVLQLGFLRIAATLRERPVQLHAMQQGSGGQRQRRQWCACLTSKFGFRRCAPYGRNVLRVDRPYPHNVAASVDTVYFKPCITCARNINPVAIVLTPLCLIGNSVFDGIPRNNHRGNAYPLFNAVHARDINIFRHALTAWRHNADRPVLNYRAVINARKLVRIVRQAINGDRIIRINHKPLNTEQLNG